MMNAPPARGCRGAPRVTLSAGRFARLAGRPLSWRLVLDAKWIPQPGKDFAMRLTITTGSMSGGLGLAGTGVALMFPDRRWIGAILIALAVLIFLFDVKIERGHVRAGRKRMGPIIVMAVGVFILGAGAVWFFLPTHAVGNAPLSDAEKSRRGIVLFMLGEKYIKENPDKATPALMAGIEIPPPEWVNRKLREDHEDWQVPPVIRTSSDPGLFVECQHIRFPIKVASDGRTFGLNLFPTPLANRGGGMGEYSGIPGSDFNISNNPLTTGYKCSVTNYGPRPMLAIRIGLNLVFQKAVRDKDNPNAVRNGEITAQRPWRIDVPKIDPGANNPFIFYIWNITDAWVNVSFPDSVEAEYIGDPERFKFRLSSANYGPLNFSPVLDAPISTQK